ncbi:hypothetical protein C1N53_21290 [Pontibacter sp. SGAir0037]|nr:hypothetical protein C1N53_21290 [Pontibacter sp. SGAir0037]
MTFIFLNRQPAQVRVVTRRRHEAAQLAQGFPEPSCNCRTVVAEECQWAGRRLSMGLARAGTLVPFVDEPQQADFPLAVKHLLG